jgi:hypothetical protein
MIRNNAGATGPRGATDARWTAGPVGRTGSIGKSGQRGLKGLTGTIYKAERLDALVTHIEDIYQQLTAHSKQIATLQQQLDQLSEAPTNRH